MDFCKQETTGKVFVGIVGIINNGSPQNVLKCRAMLLLNHYSNF